MKCILFILSFLLVGCISHNISGTYKLSNKNLCSNYLKIEIKQDSFFIYKGVNVFHKGTYKLITENNIYYLQMDTIEGIYMKDSVIIQNSGNTMNEYEHFPECDTKYLYFIK